MLADDTMIQLCSTKFLDKTSQKCPALLLEASHEEEVGQLHRDALIIPDAVKQAGGDKAWPN